MFKSAKAIDLLAVIVNRGRMKARLSTDLGDPQLLKLLKAEANEKGSSVKEVVITALEAYFSHRIENKMLSRGTEKVFSEWDDSKDSDYDQIG